MDVKSIAQGMLAGVESIPKGVAYSVRRTWDGSGAMGSDLKSRNVIETERFIRVVRAGYGIEAPLRELIMIVIRDCYQKMDPQVQSAFGKRLNFAEGAVAGRLGGQFILVQQISNRILAKVTGGLLFRWGIKGLTTVGLNVILMQGIIEQAAVSSRRLKAKYPAIYHKLTPRNLDMLYFLAEEYLEPFVAYASRSQMYCEVINHEISKVLGK
ncbi:Uncharacterised protein [Serratia marcescens]|uniref:hypothetical protein n=1 Tax=Serratia TaxID=613 RepID=UPI00074503E9|nr:MULTISPECIES: hypothetical protein [Serratia]MBJ2066965.1 hypothetical protein [Serratia odorifera]CVC02651.1 Uncharacterised protein [Serratia marcescens]CVH14517.1 Uncharacterised protein [Serratia marcescens]